MSEKNHPGSEYEWTWSLTIEQICEAIGYEVSDVLSDDRHRGYVFKRRLIALALRELDWSWHSIGSVLNKHHSTIVAYSKIMLTKDERKEVTRIKLKILQRQWILQEK